MILFVLRGCVTFFVREVVQFIVRGGCVIFFCDKRLRNFFVPRGCIFLC